MDPALEVNVGEVKQMIDNGHKFLLLDVRQPDEYAHVNIEGSKLIPLKELGQRIGELSGYEDQSIIVHCHHGGRSMQATLFLRQQGFTDVKNMAGGIDAWSIQIDPSKPRY
jgi:rhodanese-related sulfurtransferase